MREKSAHRYRYRRSGGKIRENGSRYYRIKDNPVITNSSSAYEHLESYHNKDREHFIAITLDGASRVINTHIISIGA